LDCKDSGIKKSEFVRFHHTHDNIQEILAQCKTNPAKEKYAGFYPRVGGRGGDFIPGWGDLIVF